MRKIIYLILLLILFPFCYSQQLKPSTTDNGGGISEGDNILLLSSIGQSVCGIRNDSLSTEIGFITLETIGSKIEERGIRPNKFYMGSFYPNPFNSKTQIEFSTNKQKSITLDIYDISGNKIFTWNKTVIEGNFSISFTPSETLSSGIYLYKIFDKENNVKIGKIIYTK